MPEDEVLVELHAVLAVQVDVEELAVPEGLGHPVDEVQAGHLLVTDLGVEAHHLAVLERLDEGQRMSDGGQEHVAARLVGLRLEREPNVVALVDGVLAEDVEGLLEAVEGSRGEVLRRIDLGALAAAPEDVGPGRPARRRGRGCA